jgi:hypothetical protein
MSLDMMGHIDPVFTSIPATRTSNTGGSYVDGIWVGGGAITTPHTVNIQPASDREIETLTKGGERIVDARRIYVNDGIDASISQADIWEFAGQRYKCHKLDNRPWRNYCKAIVSRIDVQ